MKINKNRLRQLIYESYKKILINENPAILLSAGIAAYAALGYLLGKVHKHNVSERSGNQEITDKAYELIGHFEHGYYYDMFHVLVSFAIDTGDKNLKKEIEIVSDAAQTIIDTIPKELLGIGDTAQVMSGAGVDIGLQSFFATSKIATSAKAGIGAALSGLIAALEAGHYEYWYKTVAKNVDLNKLSDGFEGILNIYSQILRGKMNNGDIVNIEKYLPAGKSIQDLRNNASIILR